MLPAVKLTTPSHSARKRTKERYPRLPSSTKGRPSAKPDEWYRARSVELYTKVCKVSCSRGAAGNSDQRSSRMLLSTKGWFCTTSWKLMGTCTRILRARELRCEVCPNFWVAARSYGHGMTVARSCPMRPSQNVLSSEEYAHTYRAALRMRFTERSFWSVRSRERIAGGPGMTTT